MSIADKLTRIAENEKRIYDAGKNTENKEFWDLITQNNTREAWAYLSCGWHCEYVRPPYKICPTSGILSNMFSENHALKKVESEYFDFSGYTPVQTIDTSAWYALFRASINLEEIEDLGMQAGGYYQTFSSCMSLHTIAVVRSQKETVWSSAFSNCSALENLTIEGTIGQNGFDVHWSKKLSKRSVCSILKACNADVTASPVTVTLPSKCVDGTVDTLSVFDEATGYYKMYLFEEDNPSIRTRIQTEHKNLMLMGVGITAYRMGDKCAPLLYDDGQGNLLEEGTNIQKGTVEYQEGVINLFSPFVNADMLCIDYGHHDVYQDVLKKGYNIAFA